MFFAISKQTDMYIITKDIFGTWKKGKVFSLNTLSQYLIVGLAIAHVIVEGWIETGHVEVYKSRK